MRDRKPVYEKISRNAYLQKMRPKRRQRDEIGERTGLGSKFTLWKPTACTAAGRLQRFGQVGRI